MNCLAAASRAYGPQEEWALWGARHLLEELLPSPHHWMLYDRAALPAGRSWAQGRGATAPPNSFFQQSLAPFSLVLLTGAGEWNGPSLELLFGLLAKSRVPLMALGLSLPAGGRALSRTEVLSFKRYSSLVVARDPVTRNYFKQYGIEPPLLPCPSLFAGLKHVPEPREKRITFFLSGNLGEAWTRETCRRLEALRDEYDVTILCPTAESFMRFSLMFGKKAHYSYDATDYLGWMAGADVVVADHVVACTAANSVGRPAVLLEPRSEDPSARGQLPFVLPATQESLGNALAELVAKPLLAKTIETWRDKIRSEWLRVFPQTDSWVREAA